MKKMTISILNKLGFLSFLNVYGSIKLNGKKFIIPIVQKEGVENLSEYEPWMMEILNIVLPIDPKLFIDVGVNIGQTLLKLKSISPQTTYIGFEPNYICTHYLDHLISVNNLKDISIIPIGISDSTKIGILNFFHSSATDGSASMIHDFRPNMEIAKRTNVPFFNYDCLKEYINLEDVSVIKIDVEGAELAVLKGFLPLIKEKRPILLMEILPVYRDQNTARIERQNQIQAILKEIAYSIYRVKKENENFLGFEEIDEIGIHADVNLCEYVMVPDNKKMHFVKNYNQRLLQTIL